MHQSACTLASSNRSRTFVFVLCRRCRENFLPDRLLEEPVLSEMQVQLRHQQTHRSCDRWLKPLSRPTSAHCLSSCPSGPKVFLRQSFLNTPFRLTRTPTCSPLPNQVVILFLLHWGERPGHAARLSYQGWRAKQCLFLVTGRPTHAAMQTSLACEIWAYQLADIAVYEGGMLGPRVHAGLARSYGLALSNSSSKLRFRILFMVYHTSLSIASLPKPFVGLSLVSPSQQWVGDSKMCRAMQGKYKFQFSARYFFLL